MKKSEAESRASEINAHLKNSKFLAYPSLCKDGDWSVQVSLSPQVELVLDPVQKSALELEDAAS